MPKADSVLSTQRRSVPLRKTAPTLRSPRSEPLPTIDPKTLPDLYCMGLDGDCLAPLIPDRAAVMIKKSNPSAWVTSSASGFGQRSSCRAALSPGSSASP